MKKNMFQRAALLALALILVVGLIPATSASAEESYTLYPNALKVTKDGAPEGYDGISVGKIYEYAYYTVDMDFLMDGFSAENFFKEHSQCDLYLRFNDFSAWTYSDAKATYSLINGYWSSEYPYIVYDDSDHWHSTHYEYRDYGIGQFTEPFTAPRVTVRFDLNDETPRFEYSLALYIKDHKTDEVVFSKRIRLNLCKSPSRINEFEIQNFDFQQKHGFLLKRDTKDVWCDAGTVASIRYLAEDKKTEYTETAARAGMKGWIEFTISKTQNGCRFDPEVQAKLFASGYTGETVDVTTASDGSWCKAYFHFSIPDDEKYVIKQGTIGLTAPEAGAKANSKVTLSNVGLVPGRQPISSSLTKQFKAGDALWLTINKRSKKLTPVTSFSALNIYQALVMLDPHGSYYFNADSVKAIKVPGAERFTIEYRKAGDLNGNVKEDGWYLLAVFPVVQPKTFDLTIGYDQSEITANQNSNVYLTATSSCDLSKASNVSVQWYYSRDISKDKTGELCSASDGDLKLQLDTFTVGTGYYKCVISCTLDGKTANVSYPGTEWVKLTVKEKTTSTSSLKLRPVGKQNIDITEAYQTIDFEVKPENASGEVRYQWYYCDASGKITDETPIGDGQAVLIHGITGEPGQTFYYKCVARDSKNTESLVFSCTIRYGGSTTDTTTPGGETMPPDGETTPPDGETTAPDGEATAPDTPGMPGTDTPDPGASDGTKPDEDSAGSDITGTENPPASPEPGSHLWIMILIIVLAVGATAGAVFVVIKKKQ